MLKYFLGLVLLLAITSARAEFVSAKVGVNGLTCSMCARGVEETLKQLPFIEKIKTDLNKLVVTITFKKGSHVEIDEVKKTVEDAGFTVRSIETVFNFDNVAVANDFHFTYDGNTYHFIGVKDQKLSGPVKLRFVDEPYVSKREFDELRKKTSFECYAHGKSSEDCMKAHPVSGTLYHVTLL